MNLMYIMSVPLLRKLKSSMCHLVLPHLYDTIEGYVKTYKQFSKKGDFLMQDNSLFELKEVVGGDLIDFARRIKATEVVIPEVLRDTDASIDAVKRFLNSCAYLKYKNQFQWALVLQGKSFKDLKRYYQYARYLRSHGMIHTICIPFNFEFDAYGYYDEDRRQSGWNRFSIIHRLIMEKCWDTSIDHHLLGLYNPAELSMYSKIQGIRSNDSSSCFWHSLYGVRYSKDAGLFFRKIETHVDFTRDFTHSAQYELFELNKSILWGFIRGREGNLLKKKYEEYANYSALSFGVSHSIKKYIY